MAECGTPGGFHQHYRWDEKPCDPCRLAYNAAEQARRAEKKRTHMTVPLELIALMYLNSPTWVQEKADRRMGRQSIDKAIAVFDGVTT